MSTRKPRNIQAVKMVGTTWTCLCDAKNKIRMPMPTERRITQVKIECCGCGSRWWLHYYHDGRCKMEPVHNTQKLIDICERKQKEREDEANVREKNSPRSDH